MNLTFLKKLDYIYGFKTGVCKDELDFFEKTRLYVVMQSSWNFASRAEPESSWIFPSRAKLDVVEK